MNPIDNRKSVLSMKISKSMSRYGILLRRLSCRHCLHPLSRSTLAFIILYAWTSAETSYQSSTEELRISKKKTLYNIIITE